MSINYHLKYLKFWLLIRPKELNVPWVTKWVYVIYVIREKLSLEKYTKSTHLPYLIYIIHIYNVYMKLMNSLLYILYSIEPLVSPPPYTYPYIFFTNSIFAISILIYINRYDNIMNYKKHSYNKSWLFLTNWKQFRFLEAIITNVRSSV